MSLKKLKISQLFKGILLSFAASVTSLIPLQRVYCSGSLPCVTSVCIYGEGQGGLVGVGGSVGISDKFLKWGEFFSYNSLS